MKRDLDLARTIMLTIEANEEALGLEYGPTTLGKIEGYSQEQISYHVKLLNQAGLIEAIDLSDVLTFRWEAQSLTWDGHEFLDSARNENIWGKGKGLAEKIGNASFQMLLEILLKLGKDQLPP